MNAAAPTTSTSRILESALDLFATRGYDATSIREIRGAAGITKPTLYHFFGSKDGLFRAIVGGTLEQMHDAIETALGTHGALEDRLRQVIRAAFAAARLHPRLWRFVFGTVWSPTCAPIEEMHRQYEQMSATLARALDEGVQQGQIAPGPTAVRLLVLMGTVGEALSSYLILGRPELSNELADAIVETIVSGWHPSSPLP